MKKLLPTVLSLFFTLTLLVCPTYAVSTPHVVIGEDIWLLDSATGIRIFLLPKTYYAKIDSLDDDYYYVTFNGVAGKVEKSAVSTVGYHTQAAGTMQDIAIDPQYMDFFSITLKATMDSSLNEFQVPVASKFVFLGEYPLTEMWYCVRCEDKIGYIKASRTTLPTIAIPAFAPETEPTTDGEIIEPPKDGNAKVIRIVVITAICLVALLLVFLLFRPVKIGRKKKYYEE